MALDPVRAKPDDDPDAFARALRTSAGFVFVDLAGTILVASQGVLDLLGYAGPQLTGQRLSAFVPALHRDGIAAQLAQVLRHRTGIYETQVPFVCKDRTGIDLRLRVAAIEAEGRPLGGFALLDPVDRSQRSGGVGPHAVVTPRQRQVFERLLDGVTVQEIGGSLGISVNTARMHIKNMHSATETRTLHGLAIWAIRHGDCCLGE